MLKKVLFPFQMEYFEDKNIYKLSGEFGNSFIKSAKPLQWKVDNNNYVTYITNNTKVLKAAEAVAKGVTRIVKLNGYLYRIAKTTQNQLHFKLGYAETIIFQIPKNVQIHHYKDSSATYIVIVGLDETLVNKTAAELCLLKKPNRYSGRGFVTLKH